MVLALVLTASLSRAELPADWAGAVSRTALAESPAPAAVEGTAVGALAPEAAAAATGPELPKKFQVVERMISLTNTFDIEAGGKTLGTIREKILSLTRSFDYKDSQGRCVAKAKEAFFSWGTEIAVTDCAGGKLGTIKENVFKSLFKVQTTYAILDASGKSVAQSTKVDWLGTEVTLRAGADGKGGRVAKLTRPWLQLFRDTWDVELTDSKAADPRLIVMISVYKTAVDNARRAEDDD